MVFDFIIIFIILVVTFTAAVILVKLIRPGDKESVSIRSWGSASDEKREHPRVDVRWPVSIKTETGTLKAMIRNIGVGGAFMVCDAPLSLNETATLTIETPLDQPVILNGKAIWTNVSVRDDIVVNKGMRIQFINNAKENIKHLHEALVATSQQTLPDDNTTLKTGGYENRRDSRIDVCWPVEIQTSMGSIQAETKHVSISGAFIACPQPLPLSEKFSITIFISKEKQVSINAEVVWSNRNIPDDKIVNRGMGIRFINNTKEELNPLSIALLKIVTDSCSPKD